jgi:hypothetical protein
MEQSVYENIGSLPIPKAQQNLLRGYILQETREFEYIGTETKLEGLTGALSSLNNRPTQDQAEHYDRLVRVYHHKIDGKRHRSIVDLVEKDVLRTHVRARTKKGVLVLGRAYLFRLENEGRDGVRAVKRLVKLVFRGIIEGGLWLIPYQSGDHSNDRSNRKDRKVAR